MFWGHLHKTGGRGLRRVGVGVDKERCRFHSCCWRRNKQVGVDSGLVLSRDHWEQSPHVVTSEGSRVKGKLSTSMFERSDLDFVPKYDKLDLADVLVRRCAVDRAFELRMDSKSRSIQEFLGPEFPLLVSERIGILCGNANVSIPVDHVETSEVSGGGGVTVNGDGGKLPQSLFPRAGSKIYTSNKLRAIGRAKFELHVALGTVFSNEKHLYLLHSDLEETLNIFQNESLMILSFMKQNSLDTELIKHRAVLRGGKIKDKQQYSTMKEQLAETTSIGCFYTIIGMLVVKHSKERVEKFINEKIINGPRGLVSIATDNLSQSR